MIEWSEPCTAYYQDGALVFVPGCYGAAVGEPGACTCWNLSVPSAALCTILDQYGQALADHPAQPLEPLQALLTAQRISSRDLHAALVQAHTRLEAAHHRALEVWEASGRAHATHKTEIGPVLRAGHHLERVTEAILGEMGKDTGKTPAERALGRVRKQITPTKG